MGASNKYDPSDQLDQVALYWINLCQGKTAPLTIRVLSKDRDVRLDVAGGSQIPRPAERTIESARTLAELRASWRGVEKLLLAYDGSALSADFYDTVLSFLDPGIAVTLIDVIEPGATMGGHSRDLAQQVVQQGVERAQELGRNVTYQIVEGEPGAEIVKAASEGNFDAIFMSLRGEYRALDTMVLATNTRYVLQNAPCRVILGFAPKSISQASAQAGAGQEAVSLKV